MQNRENPDDYLYCFRLIGAFSVTDAFGKNCPLPGRKDRAVLAFLAAHSGHPVARDRLVELVWPGSLEGAGRASLRQSLSTIRKALAHESILTVDRDTIMLNAGPIRTDIARLGIGDLKVSESEVAPIANGEMFLDDLSGISSEYDTWRATEQSRLSAVVAKSLISLAEEAEATQNFARAVSYLSQLSSLDPLNENAVRRLMRSQILVAQPNAAVQRYRRFESFLDKELGIRPEPETQDMFRHAMAQRSGHSGAARTEETPIPADVPEVGTPPTILVRPFRDLSADQSDTYFTDGLTEDVTIELGRFPGLRVMAPETGFAYRDTSVGAQEIAQEIGVRYILTCTVRRTSKRLRVSAQLLDANNNHLVWAERFDRELSELFDLQDDITASVVGAVAPQIEITEGLRASRAEITSMSLYDRALRAHHDLNIGKRNSGPEHVARAISAAEDILQEQPDMPQALLVLAWGHFYSFLCRWPPDPDLAKEQALDAAERLLGLEPNNVHALTVRGELRASLGQYEAALRDHRKALDINPNFTWTLFFMSICEALVGRPDEARAHAKRGLMLSPKSRDTGIAGAYLAMALASFSEDKLKDAIHWGELAIETQPKVPYRRLLVAACYGLLDRHDEAREHLEALNAFAPKFVSDFRAGCIDIFLDPKLDDLLREGLARL
ncbi:BTAD domain-containing putative transcriptional regulator [Marivita geojedonensis]|uniref:Bacterial transcriptional activator domain-containing protein n=1 Tax=Marivita geojedonensis TaxID=1123756 RepID=A0A1X4NP42_9RHOB|nr:BTAD domain-containing putative transcriptional regulator [Marivita geojedonensis]OSQ52439.1 hypothetical protein MGEO_03385 [Marivita geojedonensis]PRY73745.1 TolB-like protein [Marivita geojedonensis]